MTRRIGSRRLQAIAVVSTATVTLIATNADWAGAQLMGHQNKPSAPAGFRNRLDRMYDRLAVASVTAPGTPASHLQLPTAGFHQQVAALTAEQLDITYRALPAITWTNIEAAIERMSTVRWPAQRTAKPTQPLRAAAATAEPGPGELPEGPDEPGCAGLDDEPGYALIGTAWSLHNAARVIKTTAKYLPKTENKIPVGGIFEAIGDGIDGSADEMDATLEAFNECFEQGEENKAEYAAEAYKELREFDEPLLGGQEEIKHAIADLLAGSTGGFDTTDKEIADLKAAHEDVTSKTDDQLRMRLEAQLLSEHPTISAELPAALGGFLDTQPVGIQQIVTTALAAARSAGESISSTAPRNLGIADAALATKQYKKAFHYYQLVYRAVVS